MNTKIRWEILKAILSPLLDWLEEKSKETDNPIDDKIVMILGLLLSD